MSYLLSSPSMASPVSSPESSFGSPDLPPLSSPFSASQLEPSTPSVYESADDTPSRSRTTYDWVSDELGEEWPEQDESDEDDTHGSDDDEQPYQGAPHSGGEEDDESLDSTYDSAHSSRRRSSILESPSARRPPVPQSTYGSIHKPRVPSNLRYAFTSSTNSSNTQLSLPEPEAEPLPEPEDSPISSAGTFVMRDEASDSYRRVRGSSQGESQLQAAARAIRGGPSGGLFAPGADEEGAEPEVNIKNGGDRLGLMKLFEPPSPPAALPPSTIPAPTSDEFTFSPPPSGPKQSWKALPHFSPSDDVTPRASGHTQTFDETPSRPAARPPPPIAQRERFLHSVATSAAPDLPPLAVEDSGDHTHEDLITLASPVRPERPTTPQYEEEDEAVDEDLPEMDEDPATVDELASSVAPVKLFNYEYDTYTRDYLSAMVDEIDELSSAGDASRVTSGQRVDEDQAWEASFLDVPSPKSVEDDDVGGISDEGGRSTKRIRLSPPEKSIKRLDFARRGSLERRTGPTPRRRAPATAPRPRRTVEPVDVDIWNLAASAGSAGRTSNSGTPASIAFARSSNESVLFAPAARPAGVAAADVTVQPPTPVAQLSQPSVRDRLDEANALLSRIRARTEEKEKAKASAAAVSSPAASRREGAVESSASDDESVAQDFNREIARTPSPTEADADAPLPHLAAAASASLRSALGESMSVKSPSKLSASTLNDTPSSARRHFARTPVSSISIARRSRGRNDDPFAGTWGSSGESESEEKDKLAFSLLPGEESTAQLAMRTVAKITPGHVRHTSLTTIGPTDVQALLLASTGAPSRMVFDREQNRWIKSARKPAHDHLIEEEERSGSTEEDPFKDFDTTRASESTRGNITLGVDKSAGLSGLGITAGTPPVNDGPVDSPDGINHFLQPPVESREPEKEDSAVWSKMVDEPLVEMVSTAQAPHIEEQVEALAEHEEARSPDADPTETVEFAREDSPYHLFQALQTDSRIIKSPEEDLTETSHHEASLLPPDIGQPLDLSTRAPLSTSPTSIPPSLSAQTPITPRPALTTQPRSALKSGRSQSAPGALSTPQTDGSESRPPRSVSFSDGKTNGPIEGLHERKQSTPAVDLRAGSRLKFEVAIEDELTIGMGSMGEPGSLELVEEPGTPTFGSPAALGHVSIRTKNIDRALQELQVEAPETSEEHSGTSDIILGSFGSAPKLRVKSSRSVASNSRTFRRTTAPDATFMTDCSFGVARDNVVRYINDVEPFEPDWEGLRSINLSKKGAESMARLQDFLPNLDEIDLSDNELTFLTGIPSTVRTLVLPSNRIHGLTSFGHLRNLERVDISNNQVDSVAQLACLVHLRELKADNNQISDLGGLAGIDALVRLSLKGNCIESLDLAATSWPRLEMLNLSRNKISVLVHLEQLQALSLLNLDHNLLTEVRPATMMPRLRVLRICSNPINELDVSFAPRLRTLFVDSAHLNAIDGADGLRKLENLSIRDQRGSPLSLSMKPVRDVKRLYLSGNPIPPSFPSEKFFNLTYLELAMCGLTTLPADMASLIPNVRQLNLNFNFIDDLSPLAGLTRLQKLTAIGARLSKYRPVAEVLGTMSELESVDLRMNPLTLAFYPPLVLQQGDDLPPHSEYRILHPADDNQIARSRQWSAIDHKFRKALPDAFYLKRMSYRALVLQVVPTLVSLDGIECAKERPKLAKAMSGLVTTGGEEHIKVVA
ncbi:leucine-rich repeat protein [Pseudohyphozyma bogoriensis]|nr:leucine-rich repeat protein [Pseudohyphozyma bogoriensis]